MTILTDWTLPLHADDILRGQGVDPATVHARVTRPLLAAIAERAYVEGQAFLHPIAMINEYPIHQHRHERVLLENGGELSGPLVAHHLAGADLLAAVVCTIGADLEDIVAARLKEDPLYALAMDGLGNAAVECLAQEICRRLDDQAQAKGLRASTPLNPGDPEWPVEIGQPQIFKLVQAAEIGIRVTTGGMMVPKKSLAFIVGLGAELSQSSLCDVCNLKETCRYRRSEHQSDIHSARE